MIVYTVGPKEEIFSIVRDGTESSFKNPNPALRTGLLSLSASGITRFTLRNIPNLVARPSVDASADTGRNESLASNRAIVDFAFRVFIGCLLPDPSFS